MNFTAMKTLPALRYLLDHVAMLGIDESLGAESFADFSEGGSFG